MILPATTRPTTIREDRESGPIRFSTCQCYRLLLVSKVGSLLLSRPGGESMIYFSNHEEPRCPATQPAEIGLPGPRLPRLTNAP